MNTHLRLNHYWYVIVVIISNSFFQNEHGEVLLMYIWSSQRMMFWGNDHDEEYNKDILIAIVIAYKIMIIYELCLIVVIRIYNYNTMIITAFTQLGPHVWLNIETARAKKTYRFFSTDTVGNMNRGNMSIKKDNSTLTRRRDNTNKWTEEIVRWCNDYVCCTPWPLSADERLYVKTLCGFPEALKRIMTIT